MEKGMHGFVTGFKIKKLRRNILLNFYQVYHTIHMATTPFLIQDQSSRVFHILKTLKFAIIILSFLIVSSCDNAIETENTEEPTEQKPTEQEQEQKEEQEIEDRDTIIGDIPPNYSHLIWISFQDTLGNDLLEGSEFVWSNYEIYETAKPEFYTLDIVFKDQSLNPWWYQQGQMIGGGDRFDNKYPRLYLSNGEWFSPPDSLISPDYHYLKFLTGSISHKCDLDSCWKAEFTEKITFKLTCPYLFGDDEIHHIITWWNLLGEYNTICTGVAYNGQEFPVKGSSVATIIVNR
ncbi:hypothetical protein [Parabacteroides sp. PF5-9]|uniref:hypothetical protein n=1 Tax=Parabacteroides sp. PF5-9 TaxID=1742404 RepID=UPI0024762B19|nr:hypothetical protein [Parabacteroides sp. PF5-9]MDH6356317.1 hypothetical protein [Parabacteroides sp. PF5-9]